MRFLHTSDWHLGRSEEKTDLFEDQKFFIDAIVDIVKSKNIDAVLIAGDVYDRSVASAEATKLYDYAMTTLCKKNNVKVIEIAGNHDGPERLASCRELLASSGLEVCGVLERTPHIVEFDDVQVFLLPWFNAEKVRSLFPEKKDEIGNLTDAYYTVTSSLKESFDPSKKHIVLAHAFIADSETSTSDRSAEIGFATQVPADVFKDFDYVALGHLHKPQDVNINIRYSGTPMPYSFGKEETHDKSVTIIDTSDISNREIIKLPLLHIRRTITGTLEDIRALNCPDELRNGYVLIDITDEYAGASVQSEMYSLFPNALGVTGKDYDTSGSSISLSVEEFRKLEEDPVKIFEFFCKDGLNAGNDKVDDHFKELFKKAVEQVEEENK